MARLVVAAVLALLAVQIDAFGSNCPRQEQHVMRGTPVWPTPMKPNLKVAFFGDGGIKPDSSEVLLQHLLDRNVDFMVHAGDYDYEYSPDLWFDFLDRTVGPDYPYFAAIGNHDNLRWSEYAERLLQRLERINATQYCTGEMGVQTACNWEGLFFILSGIGTRGTGHPEFMDQQLGASNDVWKVCNWHKNQRLYQIGGKFNAVGYEVYDTCRRHGAIVATAHEHSYARSHLMSDFENQVIANTSNTLQLEPGKSFVWCSGLGGHSVREWERGLNENPWWAACAAKDNGAKAGAVVCTFNYDGDERLAYCDMIDILGQQFDSFWIRSTLGEDSIAQADTRKCHSRVLDMQITHAGADTVATSKGVREDDELLIADDDHTITLRFGVPAVRASAIDEVHLELYGLEAEDDIVLTLGVTGATMTIEWSKEDDDWEEGTVWTSPDMSDIVREALATHKDIEVFVKATGGVRAFAAYEKDPCLAPSLFIAYSDC